MSVSRLRSPAVSLLLAAALLTSALIVQCVHAAPHERYAGNAYHGDDSADDKPYAYEQHGHGSDGYYRTNIAGICLQTSSYTQDNVNEVVM